MEAVQGHSLPIETKGEDTMYIFAIVSTILAWFVGLLIDANLDVGDPMGFLCLRILLPILAMGVCIIREIHRKDSK